MVVLGRGVFLMSEVPLYIPLLMQLSNPDHPGTSSAWSRPPPGTDAVRISQPNAAVVWL